MNKVLSIIVTYNASKWLESCIGSIVNSDIPVDLAVVDNASQDDTVSIINEKYVDKIKYFYPLDKNLGFGGAHNLVFGKVDLEKYEQVLLLNQDAALDFDCMQKLLEVGRQQDVFGVLSPIHYYSRGVMDRNFKKYSFARVIDSVNIAGYIVQEVEFVNAAIWLVKSKIIQLIGGFDPIHFHYGEDRTFVNRTIDLGYKIGVVKDASGYHYRDQEATGMDKKNIADKLKVLSTVKFLDPSKKISQSSIRVCFWYAKAFIKKCLRLKTKEACSIASGALIFIKQIPAILRSRRKFRRLSRKWRH